MAAQGDDAVFHYAPGQFVKVQMEGNKVWGAQVVDGASLGAEQRAKLEADKPANAGFDVWVRLITSDALVLVERQFVEPVLEKADTEGALDHRLLWSRMNQAALPTLPVRKRASGRSSDRAPAAKPAPAGDRLDLLAAAVADGGAAGGEAAPSVAAPAVLLRPKARVARPGELAPPPPQPHPAAGSSPRAKRKRDGAADATAAAAPPAKVAAVAAPAAPEAAGAAAAGRRMTRAVVGTAAPEPLPAKAPRARAGAPPAPKPQPAPKQRPAAPSRARGQAPRAAAQLVVPPPPPPPPADAGGRGRSDSPVGRASRSAARASAPAPAAQAAAAAEPPAAPLSQHPRKPRTPRRAAAVPEPVPVAAPVPAPAPVAAPPPAPAAVAAPPPAVAAPPPAPVAAPAVAAPPPLAVAAPPPAPVAVPPPAAAPEASLLADPLLMALLTATSQPPAVAAAAMMMAIPPQFQLQPFSLVPSAPPARGDSPVLDALRQPYASEEVRRGNGQAAAADRRPPAGSARRAGIDAALPPGFIGDVPKPAQRRRDAAASSVAPRPAAKGRQAGEAAAPVPVQHLPAAMEAEGPGASGDATGPDATFGAFSGRSSGKASVDGLSRHMALVLVLHENGGEASLFAVLPRMRQLISRYRDMCDKDAVGILLNIGKERGAIRELFVFDREAASCALTDKGRKAAEDLLAGKRTDVAPRLDVRKSTSAPASGQAPAAKVNKSLVEALDAAKAEAAAQAKQYSRPAALGPGVAACHQCGLLTKTSGRSCCFGSQACGATFCEECVDTCYPSLTPEALVQKCPKCSDTCICKVCCDDARWKQPPPVPAAYPVAAEAHARYLLRMVKGSLLKIHSDQEYELACAGYDAVPITEMREGRITCDACKTAIADMFYGCCDSRCAAEFCIKCVQKMREGQLRRVHRAADAADAADAAAAGAAAGGDVPMPDAHAPFVLPPAGFEQDTPEELARLQLRPLPKLQFSAELVGAGNNAPMVYLGAMLKVLSEGSTPMGCAFNSEVALRRRFCPCSLHIERSAPASRERPLADAVLVLQRRLPRTFIPRLLQHPVVKAFPVEALPPRLDFGSREPPPEAPPCAWCARIAAATVPDENGVRDLRTNPNLRRASRRGQPDDWLWTPTAADVDPAVIGAERYADACAHFQWHWRRRQFPIVRNVHSRLDWGPGSLRVLLDRAAETEKDREMEVLICRTGHPARCQPKEFIDGYGDLMLAPQFDKSQPGDLLKLKDWPPQHSFAETVPRQYADFISILPFQEYTNMGRGALNLAHSLPDSTVPPDLGPKTYMAYGREPELRGDDSVTRLHQDMSDAVNVLMHSARADERLVQAAQQCEALQRRSGAAASSAAMAALAAAPAAAPLPLSAADVYETSSLGPAAQDRARAAARGDAAASQARTAAGAQARAEASPFQDEPAPCFVAPDCRPVALGAAGARWETFRREDSSALATWLMKQAELRSHAQSHERSRHLVHAPVCKTSEINHAIHNQAFYLTDAELKRLARDAGVHAWTFMQYDHEAVFIPAGCPHQVRNLRSCIKVALDFVSPEAAREVMVLSDEFATISNEEKLQARLMLLHAAKQALDVLSR